MIKRLLVICFLLFVFISARCQPFGNEWISYSQQYYKIKIAQNGIFRIDSATLETAGIPINSINPQNFQIFNKGIQQRIYVQGESDGVFNSADFIEFYGEKNDGKLDSLLYKNTAFLPNPYYSLINDTAVYFLTWNSSVSNSRMQIESDTAFSTFTPDNYFFKEEILSFSGNYYEGETDVVGGTDSRYMRSEGWFDGNVMDLGQVNTYNGMVNTSRQYNLPGAPNAIIKTVVVGASKDDHLLSLSIDDHRLKIEYGSNLLTDTTFKGYESNRFIKSVPVGNLGSPTTDFKYTSVVDAAFSSNRTAVSYIYVKYPHIFDLEGKSNFILYVPQNTVNLNGKAYLNITDFNTSGTVHLYDLSNGKRIDVVAGASIKAFVPNSGAEKKCYITSDGYITNITSLQPVTPTATFTDYSVMAADSAYLIITNKALMASAQDYKIYRSSSSGGMHNVVLADIDELYDQFAYGIVKSPLSIRNFCNFTLHTYPSKPHNLLLLGKSIHMLDCRQDPASYASCLVPSFGNPSSDNLLTMGLDGTIISTAIPTGRISAKTDADVEMYLDKIKLYEGLTGAEEWMKYILHFGGGSSPSEQYSFKSYLNIYKDTIQNVAFGGTVIKEFFKNSSAPIEINSSDTLRDLINNGVAMMTFFGHASGTGFDQSIDDWSTYSPAPGRYPFLLANSCYAGDFHSNDLSSSESYTFLNRNGVIGYLGSVGLGIPYSLNYFSGEFYNEIARKNYNHSVGSSIQKTLAVLQPTALGDTLTRETCYEMNLQGDPALILHMHAQPDYEITNSSVYFDLTSDPDSFKVYAIRTNLGKAINDSSFTELLRILPNGDSIRYLYRNKTPKFRDTVEFSIPVDFVNGIGLNKIKVTLDRNLEIPELSETNNSTTLVDLLINGGTIVPVYPAQFAIVPKDTITLKASTANPLAAAKNYRFQVDTTDTFLSPLKDTIINSAGGVVHWHPRLTLTDTTVYYWRVSPDSVSPLAGYSWRESSFQYIPNKRGWEQAHFFQFKNDGYQYVKFNRPVRRFDFANDIKNIYCQNGIVPHLQYYDVIYKINGDTKYLSSWIFPGTGFVFAVIDPVSGEPVQNYAAGGGHGSYGSITGYAPPAHENAFEFRDDSIGQANAINFINTAIPNGYYVLAYSQQNVKFGNYIPALKSAFQTQLGASGFGSLHDSVPYILWGRKNMGTSTELVGASADSILQLNAVLTTNWNDGYISSPVIGPAASWDSLSWRQHSIDGIPTADSIVVELIGIDTAGHETHLTNFNTSQLNIPNLGSYVPVSMYPNIRLVAHMSDNTFHTPPQLDRWQVIYTPVPEAAINPVAGYSFPADTVQQGDNIKIHLPVQNIGDIPFTQDSLLMTYWIEDANRVNHYLPQKLKKKPFNPSEILIDTISVNTTDYQGNNALWVEVNPVGKPHSQTEQYHFNNIVRIPFTVSADKINPLLDVTFDGVHILNNDIVSARPNILVKLKDENQFLALNDTNDFKVFVKSPSGSLALRVFFGNEMSFIPASLPGNSCKINYTPTLYEDGTYQLLVQAKDRSNNQSGSVDYKINFEVINRSTITEVMNYPNPFSTSTRFVFTLTGSELPTNFKIQIMTITGKVVREIFQDELGSIHIGRNITEFAWNGKDEFGDQLANGVYLYRVVTQIAGSDIERRETEADQYFKKGWGKMYLMR
ncbi:MAG: hypothetical protein JWP12_1655 [Bacteroidetes bacterium]|nr:hypothetical protein [Bacteroidota bacterium]